MLLSQTRHGACSYVTQDRREGRPGIVVDRIFPMMHSSFCAPCAGGVAMVRTRYTVAVAALAVTAACAAQAQHAPNAAALADTVVTATRTAQPLSDVLADVSIIERHTIERSGASALADVLAHLPGVELARNGGPGTSTSVYVRGAETRFTAVYIDGVRVDSQSGAGGASWEGIPLAMIERIEVLRGPAAAVYGSDAVAGVIHIFTKKGESGTAPYVGMGVGSYRTWKTEAGISGAAGSGTIDYAVGMAREMSQGFNATTKAGSNRDRDGYASTSAHARIGWQPHADHRLEGTLLYNDIHSGYDTSDMDDRTVHRLHAAGLNWHAQWNRLYATRLSITDTRDRYETAPSPYMAHTQLRGYLFHNEWRWSGHHITAALERREDQLENAPIARSRSQNALALGYGVRMGAHTVQLNARHDEDSEFGGKSTGSAAYGYEFAPHWRVTAAAATAFRTPTLYQRFSLYGDASLQPENARNVELGLKWSQAQHSFSTTLYRNRVSDLIYWVGASGTCPGNAGAWGGCYANVGQARYEGVTFAAGTQFGAWRWNGSVDIQEPHNVSNGKQLARRAKQHARLGAQTDWAGWTVGAEVHASGMRYDDANNTKKLGGYALVHLHASTRIARDYHIIARIDNLGDKNYELARGYASAGRTVYVGLKWMPQL